MVINNHTIHNITNMVLTGTIEIGLGIGYIEFFGKMILYYIYERVLNNFT